jgi:hypothetical protein
MKYAVQMSPGGTVYIPSFIKIGSCVQKLIRGFSDTQTVRRSHKPTFILQNKERRLKSIKYKNLSVQVKYYNDKHSFEDESRGHYRNVCAKCQLVIGKQ